MPFTLAVPPATLSLSTRPPWLWLLPSRPILKVPLLLTATATSCLAPSAPFWPVTRDWPGLSPTTVTLPLAVDTANVVSATVPSVTRLMSLAFSVACAWAVVFVPSVTFMEFSAKRLLPSALPTTSVPDVMLVPLVITPPDVEASTTRVSALPASFTSLPPRKPRVPTPVNVVLAFSRSATV